VASDNIAGTTTKGLLAIFLFPGKVYQWFLYMGVGSVKGYGNVRAQTRVARSPIMTWIYSFLFWIATFFFLLVGLD